MKGGDGKERGDLFSYMNGRVEWVGWMGGICKADFIQRAMELLNLKINGWAGVRVKRKQRQKKQRNEGKRKGGNLWLGICTHRHVTVQSGKKRGNREGG